MGDAPDLGSLLPDGAGQAGPQTQRSPFLGWQHLGHVSECPMERSWALRPRSRRAIDIPVRQPVTELLLFLFFELLRAIYRNHLGAI